MVMMDGDNVNMTLMMKIYDNDNKVTFYSLLKYDICYFSHT